MRMPAPETTRLADRILALQAETAAVDQLLLELPATEREAARQALVERRERAMELVRALQEELGRQRQP